MESKGLEVNNTIQLRYQEDLKKWAKKMRKDPYYKTVQMNVLVHRSAPYFDSWRVRYPECGGLRKSIGIHYIDLLVWFFGECQKMEGHEDDRYSRTEMKFGRASANFDLSITQPKDKQERTITISTGLYEYKLDLIKMGFERLHDKLYEDIMNDKGVTCEDLKETMDILL